MSVEGGLCGCLACGLADVESVSNPSPKASKHYCAQCAAELDAQLTKEEERNRLNG